METQELMELGEHGRAAFQRRIGVTMAVFAAMLAVATMMGHRRHTEEVVLQTKLADQWAYYQAKNTRSQMYTNDAEIAQLLGNSEIANTWNGKATQERQQADDVRHSNDELDLETQTAERHATMFDGSEVFIEVAIVLCSVSLLTGTPRFWRVSFVAMVIGFALGIAGFVR